MTPDYAQHPELLPHDAACRTCAKGSYGSGTCPIMGRKKGCPAWVRLTEADKPPVAQQTKLTGLPLQTVPPELVPALIPPEAAKLAESILRVWNIQTGDGNLGKYAILNRRHPAFAPLFERFIGRADGLLNGRPISEDMQYVLWCVMMLGGGARKEFAAYCERVEIQHGIDSKKEGQAS